jgi:hypothetical protein
MIVYPNWLSKMQRVIDNTEYNICMLKRRWEKYELVADKQKQQVTPL